MASVRCTSRLVLAAIVLAGGAKASAADAFRERQLRPVQLDPAALGMAECPTAGELEAGMVLAVCRTPEAKGEAGVLHLLVVDRSAEDKILYRSPGAGDSYYIRPSVFEGEKGGSVVVLAEGGAEFSYGISVYVIEPGRKVLRAGRIALGGPGEDGPSSAVPFVQVERSGSAICFRFTHDLVKMKPDGSYADVPKGKAGFKYEKGRLAPSKDCAAQGK